MNIGFIIFALTLIAAVVTSLIIIWHWKTYMPEHGRGATLFTVYTIGLGILLLGLFTSVAQL